MFELFQTCSISSESLCHPVTPRQPVSCPSFGALPPYSRKKAPNSLGHNWSTKARLMRAFFSNDGYWNLALLEARMRALRAAKWQFNIGNFLSEFEITLSITITFSFTRVVIVSVIIRLKTITSSAILIITEIQLTIVQNSLNVRQPIIHFPTSWRFCEQANTWVQQTAQKEASSAEQANAWVVRANERTDERVSRYLRLDTWLFWTTVQQGERGSYFEGWFVSFPNALDLLAGVWDINTLLRSALSMGRSEG